MMHKIFIALFLVILLSANLFADTPGKAKMHESKLSFQNIKKINGYTFYWKIESEGKIYKVAADSSFILASSSGAPYSYLFWGINNLTHKSTDTITFYNYYSPNYVIILNAVKQDSIYYTQLELSNANKIVTTINTDSIIDKHLIAEANTEKQHHYLKIVLFAIAGAVAITMLIWVFIRRKKKK
jgi:hypothetical protein